MAEPFNIEKFRQQMRGQIPDVPQPVPVQMQGAPVNGVMPPPMPQSFQSGQVPQHMPPQPQYAPQQMIPPIPPSHSVQAQPHAQNYNPSIGGQPQAWVPQGQSMPAPQMMPPPGFAPPPAAMAPAEAEVTPLKKPRFSLKRIKKVKVPELKEGKLDKASGLSIPKSSLMPFLLGLGSGVVLSLIGIVSLGSIMTKKTNQKFESIAAAVTKVESLPDSPLAKIETNNIQSQPKE